jgi:hypothetical protein
VSKGEETMIRSDVAVLIPGMAATYVSIAMGQAVDAAIVTAQDKPIRPQLTIGLGDLVYMAFGQIGTVCFNSSSDEFGSKSIGKTKNEH